MFHIATIPAIAKPGDFSRSWGVLDECKQQIQEYYQYHEERLIRNFKNGTKDEFDFDHSKRQKKGGDHNTCFSFAIGTIVEGQDSFRPYYLQYAKKKSEEISFAASQDLSASQVEHQCLLDMFLAEGKILPFSKTPKDTLPNCHPIIGYIHPGIDYHFFKVDLTYEKGPNVRFSEKNGYGAPVTSKRSLGQFCKVLEGSLTLDSYSPPTLYMCPKDWIDTRVEISKYGNERTMVLTPSNCLSLSKRSCGI